MGVTKTISARASKIRKKSRALRRTQDEEGIFKLLRKIKNSSLLRNPSAKKMRKLRSSKRKTRAKLSSKKMKPLREKLVEGGAGELIASASVESSSSPPAEDAVKAPRDAAVVAAEEPVKTSTYWKAVRTMDDKVEISQINSVESRIYAHGTTFWIVTRTDGVDPKVNVFE